MKIEETSVVLDIYSDKINDFAEMHDDEDCLDWAKRWATLEEPLRALDCWDIDFINWSTKGDHINLITLSKNKEKVIKFLKEFESNL